MPPHCERVHLHCAFSQSKFILTKPFLQMDAPTSVYFVTYNIYFTLLILQFLLTFFVDRPKQSELKSPRGETQPLLHTSNHETNYEEDSEETSSAVGIDIYYPPEVRGGEYWGLRVFLLYYLPPDERAVNKTYEKDVKTNNT